MEKKKFQVVTNAGNVHSYNGKSVSALPEAVLSCSNNEKEGRKSDAL